MSGAQYTIAHLSDIHAGYHSGAKNNAQGINLREADGYLALSQMITEIIQEKVNAVVIAGDTFHSPKPTPNAIIFVQNQLRRLAKAGIRVYILAGNHDTVDVKADIAASRILHDPARGIYSHVEPYVQHEIGDGIFLHLVSHHLYSEQGSTMEKITPVEGQINIFSTHGSCIDPLLKLKLHTNQSPREIVIPDHLLVDKNWSYTLLGHIHERGYPGSKDGVHDTLSRRVYYNGSLIRRGFSDAEVPLGRGWTLWNVDSDGTFTPDYRMIPQRPQYDFLLDAKGMSSGDISEAVVKNLLSTQVNGENFDAATAPMVRQRLKNISPATHSALDWATINASARHTLEWKPKVISQISEDEDEIGARITGNETLGDSSDVVSLYDDWVKDSQAMEQTPENLRESVETQTRRFVELGQEVTLND